MRLVGLPRGEKSPKRRMRRVVPSPRGEKSPNGGVDYGTSVSLILIKRLYEDLISFEVTDHMTI
jgi:hypothetical protein